MPARVCDLDLSESLQPISGTEQYDWLYILIRSGSRPVGWVSIDNPHRQASISGERIRQAVVEQLGWELAVALLKEEHTVWSRDGRSSPPISIVVCTRDRTDQLAGCLHALWALEYPRYEIIVVDNAPSGDATARFVRHHAVRYALEPRPGLDWARNRGIADASFDLIAFTDDDARPDRHWLRALAHAFADPEVMCVTGFIAPAELETRAQHLFEFVYGGMGKGFNRRTFKAKGLTDRDLLWANAFGVGANMAFRRRVFEHVGSFDVALDAGTPSGGAGDLDMFHRVVANGFTLVYEPAAMVRHIHRRSEALLQRQLYDNGRSFGSYLLTCVRNKTVGPWPALKFVMREWMGKWLVPRLVRPNGLPRSFVFSELRGALKSPLAYRASQRHARHIAAKIPAESPPGSMLPQS